MKIKARRNIDLQNGMIIPAGSPGEALNMRQGADGKVRGFEAIFYGFPHVIVVQGADVEDL